MGAPATAPTDFQRENVIHQLRAAVGTGQLSLDEFEDRAGQVYRAMDGQQLAAAASGLPQPPAPPAAKRLTGYQLAMRIEWAAWLSAGLINLIVWAAVSAGTGEAIYFWPIWVIGPWGLVLAGRELAQKFAFFTGPPPKAVLAKRFSPT